MPLEAFELAKASAWTLELCRETRESRLDDVFTKLSGLLSGTADANDLFAMSMVRAPLRQIWVVMGALALV